jgi:hypothetical protein
MTLPPIVAIGRSEPDNPVALAGCGFQTFAVSHRDTSVRVDLTAAPGASILFEAARIHHHYPDHIEFHNALTSRLRGTVCSITIRAAALRMELYARRPGRFVGRSVSV